MSGGYMEQQMQQLYDAELSGPSMSDLLKLAERVESAAVPDQELDAEIERILPCSPEFSRANPGKKMSQWNESAFRFYRIGDEGHEYHSPRYTASLDIAMTLIPEGRDWFITSVREKTGLYQAAVFKPAGPMCDHSVSCKSPALALCTAALRARATVGRHNIDAGVGE